MTVAPHRVLIAGGGVAGLEAALALRELAGDRVSVTMLAPDPDFIYRPLRVREPFGGPTATRFALTDLTANLGIELIEDAFEWIEPAAHRVHTAGGTSIEYDSALIAIGARQHRRFAHAVTLNDRDLDAQLHGVIQDVEGGYAASLVFLQPSPAPWPLPLYELALMTARRAWEMNLTPSITLVTPEPAPLAVFGRAVSEAVSQLLVEQGILTLTEAHADTQAPGLVTVHPGDRVLHSQRVIALPELYGPSVPGLPKTGPNGFIPVDERSRVRGIEDVFAAGDATEFPLKFGGLAAAQADVAAHHIARAAGVALPDRKLDPVVHGVLLGGDRPLHLKARITGTWGSASEISREPIGGSTEKLDAVRLTTFLNAHNPAPATR